MMEQLAGSGGAATWSTSYFAAMMNIFGALAAGFVVQALLRLRSEEAGGTGGGGAGHGGRPGPVGGRAPGLRGRRRGGDAGARRRRRRARRRRRRRRRRACARWPAPGWPSCPAALAVAGFVVLVFGGLPRLVVVAGLGRRSW